MTNKELLLQLVEKIDNMDSRLTNLENGKKPTTTRGKGKSTSTKKSNKPSKTYKAFTLKGKGFKAQSIDSKNGNPNAVLTITFNEKPSDKVRMKLKAYGFKWNTNLGWYNANTEDAQEVFDLLK